ncbi:unnamed protein product [Cyprideis torosa]|uniref:Uncharacterized protein n=1 Tax=Cyprideis torosa TaxID=163714 RepID=A0A7R8ZYQ9_9CRUS|nr:unnamed protein product [Cyprideis torosa]CAG0908881.1 unnamed protein product [Cyprideis torosa]
MVLMSTAVLPQMQDRRKGLVINVGSFSSESQTPFMSVYASTKAFVESFSFSLAQEFAGTGVRIICTKPGFVITKMIENMVSESVLWPGPDAYVESHLKTAAIIPMTNGYWFHDVLSFVGSIMKNVMPFVFVTLNTSVMRPRGFNQTRKNE